MRVHSGCYIEEKEALAFWSERYSDPKLDDDCYLVKVVFKNSPTILTMARFDTKKEADDFLKELYERL